jgi:hypothetical protein
MVLFGPQQLRALAIIYCFGPVLMAAIGFIFFALSAAIYNLLAGWLGGFEFEVKEVQEELLP